MSDIKELSDFECSVCHEYFTEPKLLPCGHLLCKECLLNWVKTKDDARCPLCRDVIVSSTNQQYKSLEEVVNGFPTDLSMELALKTDQILNRQHKCCVCEDVAATSMCMDCKDMYCQSCEKAHGKMSATKHHIVEDLSTLTAEKLTIKNPSPCSVHPEEIPKLFCPNHGEDVCFLCLNTKHRNCPDVKDIGMKMEEMHALLKRLAAKIAHGETELDKSVRELDEYLQNMEEYSEAAAAEIEEMCDQLEALVTENRHHMKEQVVNARAEIREAVKEGRNCLLQKQTKLTTHARVIQRISEIKNSEVATTMSMQMKKRIDDLDCRKTLPDDAKSVPTFTFFPNPAAVVQIRQMLTELGEIEVATAKIKANRKMDFFFHDNHGTSITLSNNRQTASKSYDGYNGIVLSHDPLETDTLYEVRIDRCTPGRPVCVGYGSMLVGVATDPARMTLAAWSGQHIWPAWICPSYTYWYGSQDYSNKVGAALLSLGVNHRVGLALDSARCLHLYVNGQNQGIAVRNLPDPCYAMFDVVDQYEQITALPAIRLE